MLTLLNMQSSIWLSALVVSSCLACMSVKVVWPLGSNECGIESAKIDVSCYTSDSYLTTVMTNHCIACLLVELVCKAESPSVSCSMVGLHNCQSNLWLCVAGECQTAAIVLLLLLSENCPVR